MSTSFCILVWYFFALKVWNINYYLIIFYEVGHQNTPPAPSLAHRQILEPLEYISCFGYDPKESKWERFLSLEIQRSYENSAG